MQFWPRKRARRIYPRINADALLERAKPGEVPVFLAYKVGMTHVSYIDNYQHSPTYRKEVVSAVTVLEIPRTVVVGIRYYRKAPEGWKSAGEEWTDVSKMEFVQRKYPKKKATSFSGDFDDFTLIVATDPSTTGVGKKKGELFEVPIGGPADEKLEKAKSMLGNDLNPEEFFSEGEYVDVTAVTKGHGFTGPVKRFGIRIQGRKDKQHHRHVGSIGTERPGRVWWTVPRPGQHGFHQRTELNKRLLKFSEPLNVKGGWLSYGLTRSRVVIIEGSVPGPRKRPVLIRKALRPRKPLPVEISYISLESKQGR